MKSPIIFLLAISTSAIALESHPTICKLGDRERKIEIVYPNSTEVPCEVLYTKESESQILWSAKYDVSYCLTQAAELVSKHQSWGWQCEVSAIEQEATDESNLDSDVESQSSETENN